MKEEITWAVVASKIIVGFGFHAENVVSNISRLFIIYTKKNVSVRKGLRVSNFRVPIRTNWPTSRISINHPDVKSLKPILKNVYGNPKNQFRQESVQI